MRMMAIGTLNDYPAGTHQLFLGCTLCDLEGVQNRLGKMPVGLVELLVFTNGARLFCKPFELVTLFRLTNDGHFGPMEWGPDWFVDTFTPKWRAQARTDDDWAFAMKCYGGLVIMHGNGTIQEWDTQSCDWMAEPEIPSEWLARLRAEGDLYLAEN